MKSDIKKAKKALSNIHQEYLLYAMSQGDKEYAKTMNATFKLLERLEGECD